MYNFRDLQNLFASIIIILVPNMIIILLAYMTGTERLLINIDYFIPLLFLVYRQHVLFVIAFIIASLLDFLVIFTQLFPFIRLSDLLYLSKFAFISSSSYQLYGITLILLIIAQIYIYLKRYKTKYSKVLLGRVEHWE